MRDQRDLMIERQKQLVSDLNSLVSKLRDDNARLNSIIDNMRDSARYYEMIQTACRESPVVANEFARFIMTCRLAEDAETTTPGLTSEEQLSLKL